MKEITYTLAEAYTPRINVKVGSLRIPFFWALAEAIVWIIALSSLVLWIVI
jgi:hypothetical protein